MEYATPMRRMFGDLLDTVLFFVTLIIGYIIWWLIILGRGQTPGKQLVGIRAVRRNGDPAGPGTVFVREVVKIVAHFFTIGFFADLILLLIDEEEHRSLSDRVANTVIIRNQPPVIYPDVCADDQRSRLGMDPRIPRDTEHNA